MGWWVWEEVTGTIFSTFEGSKLIVSGELCITGLVVFLANRELW